jgi:hypothetical protein
MSFDIEKAVARLPGLEMRPDVQSHCNEAPDDERPAVSERHAAKRDLR